MKVRYDLSVEELADLIWDGEGAIRLGFLGVLAETVESRFREEFASDLYYLIEELTERGLSRLRIASDIVRELRPEPQEALASGNEITDQLPPEFVEPDLRTGRSLRVWDAKLYVGLSSGRKPATHDQAELARTKDKLTLARVGDDPAPLRHRHPRGRCVRRILHRSTAPVKVVGKLAAGPPDTGSDNTLPDSSPRTAAEFIPLVYEHLRSLAREQIRAEPGGHALQATDLVHEAYLRLMDGGETSFFRGRWHFYAVAAEAMRRVLVDRRRRQSSLKRGGQWGRVDLDPESLPLPEPSENIAALDEGLEALQTAHPEKAQLVKLRYFAGLTIEEAAGALGVSVATANRHWAYAKAWLYRYVQDASGFHTTQIS